MYKFLGGSVLAVAVGISSVAVAQQTKHQATHHKRDNAAAPAAAPAPCATGWTFANGACMTPAQVAATQYARAQANCMVQTRMNYNWCPDVLPSGHVVGPIAKDIFVFDQSPRGIQSSPGGAASDAWLKRDITQLAMLNNGIALYRFRYFWSDQVYVGVMAQQVAQIEPDAVVRHPDGFLYVNYDRLGLKMQTWEEWQANRRGQATAQP